MGVHANITNGILTFILSLIGKNYGHFHKTNFSFAVLRPTAQYMHCAQLRYCLVGLLTQQPLRILDFHVIANLHQQGGIDFLLKWWNTLKAARYIGAD